MNSSDLLPHRSYGAATIAGQSAAHFGDVNLDYGGINVQHATFLLTRSSLKDELCPRKIVRHNRVTSTTETLETVTIYNDGNVLQRGASQTTEYQWRRAEDLGVGIFGEVHKEETIDGRARAVKVLRRRQLVHMKIDYKKELDALIQLSQPSYNHRFVEFLSWYEDNENICLAMEYVPHGDLSKFVGRVEESDTKQIAYQVLDGIRVMHRLDLIHRDIKPANIFVVQPSPVWWVKIGDFSIAKSTVTRQTQLRTKVGTEGYQAPEILGMVETEKSGIYDSRCDIWSFGCLVFELLSGRLPFPDNNLFKYCNYELRYPGDVFMRKGASFEFADFVYNLLRIDPFVRPDAEQAMFLLAYRCKSGVTLRDRHHVVLKTSSKRWFNLPWSEFSTWSDLCSAVLLSTSYVEDDDLGEFITTGDYEILDDEDRIIDNTSWSALVRPGVSLRLRAPRPARPSSIETAGLLPNDPAGTDADDSIEPLEPGKDEPRYRAGYQRSELHTAHESSPVGPTTSSFHPIDLELLTTPHAMPRMAADSPVEYLPDEVNAVKFFGSTEKTHGLPASVSVSEDTQDIESLNSSHAKLDTSSSFVDSQYPAVSFPQHTEKQNAAVSVTGTALSEEYSDYSPASSMLIDIAHNRYKVNEPCDSDDPREDLEEESCDTSLSLSSQAASKAETVNGQSFVRRGNTKIPRRLVHTQALFDLGYPFNDEDEKMIVIEKALGSNNIEELFAKSHEYFKRQSPQQATLTDSEVESDFIGVFDRRNPDHHNTTLRGTSQTLAPTPTKSHRKKKRKKRAEHEPTFLQLFFA